MLLPSPHPLLCVSCLPQALGQLNQDKDSLTFWFPLLCGMSPHSASPQYPLGAEARDASGLHPRPGSMDTF